MSRRTLSLVCPHCFCRLHLQDRGIVGKRSDCPQCHEIFYLSPHPERGVVGLLPGKHSASALLIHGVLSVDVSPVESATKPVPVSVESPEEPQPKATQPDALTRAVATVSIAAKDPARQKPRETVVSPVTAETGSSKPNAATHSSRSPSSTSAPVPKRVKNLTAKENVPLGGVPAVSSSSWTQRFLHRGVVASGAVAVAVIFTGAILWFGSSAGKENPRIADAVTNRPTVAATEEIVPPEPHLETVTAANSPSEAGGGTVVVAIAEVPTEEEISLAKEPEVRLEPADAIHEPAVAEIPNLQAPVPPVAKVDIEQRLLQPIKKFEQVRAVPVRELLELLEELLGVPVEADRKVLGELASGLDRPVSLKLNSTTVGGILSAVLNSVGLGWEIDDQTIRIIPPAAGETAVSP